MAKQVIFSECSSDFWIDAAGRLEDTVAWQPCYWIAAPNMETSVTRRFPSAVFHSNLDAARGIPPPRLSGLSSASLDEFFLATLANCQVTTLRMMDRMDALGSFSFDERNRHYYRLVGYWSAVLRDVKPDLVVFSQAPHLIYDYVLYCLCKQQEIPTKIFEFTRIGGLIFLTDSIEGETPVMKIYQRLLETFNQEHISLSNMSEEHIIAMAGTYDSIPVYINPFYGLGGKMLDVPTAHDQRNLNIGSFVSRYITEPLFKHLPVNALFKHTPENYMKQTNMKLEQSQIQGLTYSVFRKRSRAKIRELKRYYHKLANKPDLTKPYIYVPLAFQPERTTSPLGGVFVNQLLMVDILSKCLPKNWNLYIREHPTQFYENQAFRAQSGRSKDLYDDLSALPNVQLVDMSIPSFDLTDNSRAVASVVSTAGWEAVIRGKPSITFGYPWYRGCEGVFQAQTEASCQSAINKIADGFEVEARKVRLFIKALEEASIIGYVDPFYAGVAGISPEENAESLALGLKNH